MNADQLLSLFDRVSEAPDAVAKLRRFVLDLAVRGKLVEQDPADEPASELLKRIAEAKAAFERLGRSRRERDLSLEETPFDLPNGWLWTAIRDVTSDRGQAVPSAPFTYIDVTSINKEEGRIGDANVLQPDEAPSRARKIVSRGDVVYSCVRPYLLNVAVIDNDLHPAPIASTAFAVLNAFGLTLPRYIWIVLRSPFMVEEVEACMRGQAYPAINDADFAKLPFPLPPLAEQHRIVARVDELMALCDQLEAARAERERRRDRLAAATLARLNTLDPETFQADARFALEAFSTLTARSDQTSELRQAILNLAVKGKLTPQDQTDGTALILLKRLSADKARMVGTGTISRPKESERDPDRQIADLPASWIQIALGQVCAQVTSGSRGWAEHYSTAGAGFIRAQNIRFGRLRLDGLAYVNPPANSEGSRTQVASGDLLIVITGAGVTNPALLEQDLGEAYVSQHVGLVRPVDRQISQWLLLCLMAPAGGRAELVDRGYGAGKPGLNLDNIRSLTIPLPPLAEQHRIVARVDELMALCDQLEAALTAADTANARLLDAILHEALNGSLVAEAA